MPESGKDLKNSSESIELDSAVGALPENVTRAIKQQLNSLRAAGVQVLPIAQGKYDFSSLLSEPQPEPVSQAEPVVSSPNTTQPEQTHEPNTNIQQQPIAQPASIADTTMYENRSYGAKTPSNGHANQLQVIQGQVSECTACTELCSTRTQTVFGVGNPNARLVFLGEAPGADEDRLGEPFVGAAGQLLDKIIGAMKLSREEVYILNTLKCRPPSNRNPKDSELMNCSEFTERQLEIIQPEFICCLGSIAAKTLLSTKQSISRMRGQFVQWRGSRVICTYHPAYLLRTPTAKKMVWEDMKLLMKEMGI